MLHVHRIDKDLGRIIYKGRDKNNKLIYYAMYQETPIKFTIYRLSDFFKPQSVCSYRALLSYILMLPGGESQIEIDVREFILNN